jgi:hypothetical protein
VEDRPANRHRRHRTSVQNTKPVCHTCLSLTSTMPRNRKIMASLVELKEENWVTFLASNYKNSWCCCCSVSVATVYGLDGPGIESRWGARFFAQVQTGPGAHPASCTMGTGSFPGVESGRSVTLTPRPLLVLRSKNRVELYLYSP